MGATKTRSHESKLYYGLSRSYEKIFARFFGPRIQAALQSLDIPDGARVLEVGVGTGLSLSAYPNRTEVIAVDLSPAMLAQAQEEIDRHDWSHITLKEMDAQNLEFPDEQFDYVAAFHVVTVVPDHERLIREMTRVCKPGGTVVIINHFRSHRWWIARFVDLLDPITRHFGWRTTMSVADLMDVVPLEIQRRYKTAGRSLFTVIIAKKKTGASDAESVGSQSSAGTYA
jgi:phosphatidylethanolamine/phosphatidyl-N-methylethanolamine N-methyltransferase